MFLVRSEELLEPGGRFQGQRIAAGRMEASEAAVVKDERLRAGVHGGGMDLNGSD